MATLPEQLDRCYPGWRLAHSTAVEAAIEVGLLDEDELDAAGVDELDFNG